MRILVLALGNPLRGDDGVGQAVLGYLSEKAPVFETTLLDGGTPGLETILLMQGYDRVIILDAADMGLPAGEWRRFEPNAVELSHADLNGTLHSAGLAEALTLGSALGLLPPEVIVYGIQPQDIGWEAHLSEAVQNAVPVVGAAIYNELEAACLTVTF